MRAAGVSTEIVVMTAYSTVESAVEVMKAGAADYLSKPFSPPELIMVLEKVASRSALMREIASLRQELGVQKGFEGIVGESPLLQKVFALIGESHRRTRPFSSRAKAVRQGDDRQRAAPTQQARRSGTAGLRLQHAGPDVA